MTKAFPESARSLVAGIFSRIPYSFLGKATGVNLIIPYYHLVNDARVAHVAHLYPYKTTRQFRDDIDFLLKEYTPVALSDVLGSLRNGTELPKRAFLMTFDDGFREMHEIVAPILLEKGVPAVFFINSDFIDNRTLCYQHKASLLADSLQGDTPVELLDRIEGIKTRTGLRRVENRAFLLAVRYEERHLIDEFAQVMGYDFARYLKENQPYLTSHQINDLIGNGFAIGAHSLDHPLYSALTIDEQVHQTLVSVAKLRETFNLPYGVFAFPHNDHNVSRQFFRRVHESGIVDITFGTGGMIEDCIDGNLQRISFERPLMTAEKTIALQFAKRTMRAMRGESSLLRE